MQAIEGDFKVDKTSWVALYDVDLRLEEREHEVMGGDDS